MPRRQILIEATDALGDFTAKTQESDGVARNLGNVLLRYVPIVPGGVLVFLPKYSLVERVMDEWAADGTLGASPRRTNTSSPRREAPTRARTDARDVSRRRRLRRGRAFLAVYRGKVSEGLDFKDENARAVFCVGFRSVPGRRQGETQTRV